MYNSIKKCISDSFFRNYLEKFETIDLRQKAFGLTVVDFCENEWYSISTFGYWRRQLKTKWTYDANAAFAPLIINSQSGSFSMEWIDLMLMVRGIQEDKSERRKRCAMSIKKF